MNIVSNFFASFSAPISAQHKVQILFFERKTKKNQKVELKNVNIKMQTYWGKEEREKINFYLIYIEPGEED